MPKPPDASKSTKPTFAVEITIHSAHNLPVADMNTLSCDPYVHATIFTPSIPSGPSEGQTAEDPPLTFRTPTVRRSRQAEWCPASSEQGHSEPCRKAREGNSAAGPSCVASGKWVVGGMPKDGFKLQLDLLDEDPGDKDDRLGRAEIGFTSTELHEGYEVKEQQYPVKKWGTGLRGSRVIVQTYLAAMLPSVKLNHHAHLVVSMKVLHRTDEDMKGKVFTIGPNRWSQHFSPLLGHIQPARHANPDTSGESSKSKDADQPKDSKLQAFNASASDSKLSSTVFIGNKLQLTGPVPIELRHEFVPFRPFISWMFKSQGVIGHIASHALHKQYRTVYSYNKRTRFGVVAADGEDEEQVARANVNSGEEVGDLKGHPAGAEPSAKGNDHHDESNDAAKEDQRHSHGEQHAGGNQNIDQHPDQRTDQSSNDRPDQTPHPHTNGQAKNAQHDGKAANTDTGPNVASAHARAFALQFLQMCAFGAGGRMFTYVITLDGEWRWTETGAEFAVNLLSKHTMHADVSRTIAWSGEFFVRRVVDKPGGGFPSAIKVEDGSIVQEVEEEKRNEQEKKEKESQADGKDGKKKDGDGGDDKKGEDPEDKAKEASEQQQADAYDEEVIEDPAQYELVIDNDSGTYRPHKELLPILRDWLADSRRLGGLGRVTVVDGFDPVLGTEKKARQAARTKKKGLSHPDSSDGSPPSKSDQVKEKMREKGMLGKAVASAEAKREQAMEIVGKDESHAKSKSGAPRMAMVRSGSSISSIDSGVLGPGRRSSVSSSEVKDALRQADASGGEPSGGAQS